jgi:hypothetical protein
MFRPVRAVSLCIVLAACGNNGGGEELKKTTEQPRKLSGVYPEKFACDSVTPDGELGQVLGGTVRAIDNPASVPRGVARPCNYEVTIRQPPEYWTYDIDCRNNMKQTADALFVQYTRTSAELVDQYNAAADAQPEPAKRDASKRGPDAGNDAPQRAPEAASLVDVGAKGLDHHGQGLLFIDDDAPCYVRVVGPDRDRRLALAKLIAKNLTFQNAPMTPRLAP